MKKNQKKSEWVDFSLKINFIYEKLFKNNKERLIANFFAEPKDEQERVIGNFTSGIYYGNLIPHLFIGLERSKHHSCTHSHLIEYLCNTRGNQNIFTICSP